MNWLPNAGTVVLSLLVTAPMMYTFTFLVTVSPNSQNESNLVDVINDMSTNVLALHANVLTLLCLGGPDLDRGHHFAAHMHCAESISA